MCKLSTFVVMANFSHVYVLGAQDAVSFVERSTAETYETDLTLTGCSRPPKEPQAGRATE